MKKIVLKLYEFDELSKDSQERIIEREHWNVMEQCMDAYGIDYKKSMKAFEDMTDTRVYNWEVGYERYDFSYEFKYKDPIYEHPTDYHRDIFPENLCGKLLFRYINNNIMPYIIKGKYFSTSGKYIDGKYKYRQSDLRERHPRCHGRRYRWSRRVWVRRSGKRGVRPCSLDWLNR